MPNIKSAKKRVKIIARRTARNKDIKSQLKTLIKNFLASLQNGFEEAEKAYKVAVKRIDQAASKGVIHKNSAARKKHALTLKLNSLSR